MIPLSKTELFEPARSCWVCGNAGLRHCASLVMDLSIYRDQDPELAEYRDLRLDLLECPACGFAQPEALPTLPRFFDRMYDQQWSPDWIANEFTSCSKDLIFGTVLDSLEHRSPGREGRLLDVGAHVGRLLHLATARGWQGEGIELNPRTRAYAETATGLPVHGRNARELADAGSRYRAITLIDVLEHIPEPVGLLKTLFALLEPGGVLVVKILNGRAQRWKERAKARTRAGYRPSLADNLVHVNHFGPQSLRLALEAAGFEDVEIQQGAPEEVPPVGGLRGTLRNRIRPAFLVYYLLEAQPSRLAAPLYLHLQACARRPEDQRRARSVS